MSVKNNDDKLNQLTDHQDDMSAKSSEESDNPDLALLPPLHDGGPRRAHVRQRRRIPH